MIQYITMLITCEHKRNLFYIRPHHLIVIHDFEP